MQASPEAMEDIAPEAEEAVKMFLELTFGRGYDITSSARDYDLIATPLRKNIGRIFKDWMLVEVGLVVSASELPLEPERLLRKHPNSHWCYATCIATTKYFMGASGGSKVYPIYMYLIDCS